MNEEISVEPVTPKRRGRVPIPIWETPQWRLMRQALDKGYTIVSFDAEWEYQPPNRVAELGVAVLRDGEIKVHNVRVRGRARSFDNGKTMYLAEDAAKAWLQATMRSAEILVGHALQNDRLKMRQWGCPLPKTQKLPTVDTGAWSRLTNPVNGNPRRLAHLADEYGIERKGMHVAGKDALVTLRVALAMAAAEPEG
ncbi:hypothetical protein L7H23_08815 [Sphingopyxis sp. BSN-002]|uniref:hypothetical protein n=1 Tax=Sphingopyxis sp. BSN-002 TaxID=2911495 RepID=UPI001EDC41CD|nr:hypothetical protein [Sphingopyxis sp. BSN-002]UKK86180.1 hypothetical protein L7H23_08815 [Sphingopyxis sp. BSN-002]